MTWPNKTLKQSDTFRCMAYVAAMIAGCDVEEVFRFCGHDGSATDGDPRNRHPEKRRGFTNQEINAFLASRGICLNSVGAYAENGQLEFKEHEGNRYIWAWIPLYLAAEVVVESDRIPGGTHSVYWDGKVIRDSNPDKANETAISDYRIRSWHPVVDLNEGEPRRMDECPRCAVLEKVAHLALYEDVQMDHLTSYLRDELLTALGLPTGPYSEETVRAIRRYPNAIDAARKETP